MKIYNKRLAKRIAVSTALGAVFGFLCFAGFSSNPDMPAELAKLQAWSWSNPMMWSTVANRYALGFVVGIAGLVTVHPVFGFKFPPLLRGAGIGFLISLSMALGALIGGNQEASHSAFWIVLFAGIVIGAIIDFITTKVAGEGEYLQKSEM